MKYKVFCDGASRSNPGEASIGVSIEFEGKEIYTISKAIGIATVSYTHLTLPTSDLV